MDHFSIYEWADFARQVSSSEHQRTLMQEHLDAGCSKCLKHLDLWRTIVNFGIRELKNEPPAWAVRGVNAGFGLRKSVPKKNRLDIATLLFDSALQPSVAGVRGTAAVARQLLYKSGTVCIDMRMQPKPGSDSVVLVGQVLDSAKPDRGIGGIPVSLISQGEKVSHGKTNDIGEFDFGIELRNQMQLVLGIGKGRAIIVPIPDSEGNAA